MKKTKLALLLVVALLSVGATVSASADEVINQLSVQSQTLLGEQNEFDTSNILSVFYDGKDTHVTLTDGEILVLENYEGKFGEFGIISQVTPSRLRAIPTSKYLTTTWFGYGNSPTSMHVRAIYSYNEPAYGGWVQALFEGNVGRISGSQGTAGGQSVTYGGNVPRVAISPA